MAKYIPYDYNQNLMVVINFQDQLQPGTFEYALHYLVTQRLDLSIFAEAYKNDEQGRPAYDPAILLKIILFAYSKGITSSREIQWCCETNILFKALSCDSVPHFTTIAAFVSGYPTQIESLFEQVLLICHEQGLLGNELFAIDGCKLSSNAAKTWSGTHQELKDKRDKLKRLIRHHLAEHQKHDQQDEQQSAASQRIQQTIDTLNQAAEKIEKFLDSHEPRLGQGKRKTEVKSNITDNDSAKMTTSKGTIQGYNGIAAVDKKHQIIIDAQAFGEGQEQHTLKPILESIKARYQKLKIHDDIYATGAIITADTGFANERNMKYLHEHEINGFIPDNQFRSRDPKFAEQNIKYPKPARTKPKYSKTFPASEFNFDPVELSCECPAGKQLHADQTKEDRYGNRKIFFRGRLQHCRDCELKSKCMRNPQATEQVNGYGRQVSFIINKQRQPNYTDWMKHRVDSPKGKQIYSHRMSVVEPVFGNLTINKGLKRFSLRGKTKVNAQWKLFCLIQNIEKLANYGQMAA
ncbi:IS1182 family transposase [Methylomonas sp. MgM2]